MFLLHVHGEEAVGIPEFVKEIFWHGILDTLNLIPFLFVTYLLMEYIEHKAKAKTEDFIRRSGGFAPIVGGLVGGLPQCGFSAVAANLYSARLISVGTLIAVFLATSDEMIPILISGRVGIGSIIAIVGYKILVAIVIGLVTDLILRRFKKEARAEEHHCEDCHCHHDGGILKVSLVHTLKITIFVLLVNFAINALVYFVGEDTIGSVIYDRPVISHFVAAMLGLIPNCAASVALTTLATEGLITAGTMMAGLFSGAGIGLAVLLRENRPRKASFAIISALVIIGTIFGFLADVMFPNILNL